MSELVLTPEQAEALAARTFAAIDREDDSADDWQAVFAADRERVASDLRAFRRAEEGLGEHEPVDTGVCVCLRRSPCPDARRYAEERADAWDSLVRTASLYGEPVR